MGERFGGESLLLTPTLLSNVSDDAESCNLVDFINCLLSFFSLLTEVFPFWFREGFDEYDSTESSLFRADNYWFCWFGSKFFWESLLLFLVNCLFEGLLDSNDAF